MHWCITTAPLRSKRWIQNPFQPRCLRQRLANGRMVLDERSHVKNPMAYMEIWNMIHGKRWHKPIEISKPEVTHPIPVQKEMSASHRPRSLTPRNNYCLNPVSPVLIFPHESPKDFPSGLVAKLSLQCMNSAPASLLEDDVSALPHTRHAWWLRQKTQRRHTFVL